MVSIVDAKTKIVTCYLFYVEAVQVHLDCTWSQGCAVSFRQLEVYGLGRRLFTKKGCPQAFRWKPRQTKQFWDHISIEYARNECERCDLVVKFHDAMRMAKQAKYDRQGNTHLKIKQMFSFGRSTTLFRVHKHQSYSVHLRFSVVLEFSNSADCLHFIQHDMWKLGYQRITPEQKDGESKIIDDLCEAVAPQASDYRHAEINAIQRCLSESQFFDEYPGPETQVISIRHQAHASNPRHLAHRCHLTLQLAISSETPEDPLIISQVHWSATDSPLAFPSPFNPFQYLSNLHLGFPLPVPRDRNRNSWSLDCQGQGSLTVTISDREVTFSESVNCVPTTNGFTINSTHRSVIVNYIKGDVFLGPISGGNVGGTNNTNHSHSRRTWDRDRDG
ncbi:hypothetical protein BDN71DRAFT_1294946 [Pleurotus eryngii]|uniref:Uncharacterized protein n=1 Tax=Pleurotus eryngii TaxID=5323 RepID=A0A9P6DCD9_PLEER|nr:hypothetical protein BDN71DRAFT_1294946 [Pleurotus eryngii]